MEEVLKKKGIKTKLIKSIGIINELYKIVYRFTPKQNIQIYSLIANNPKLALWIAKRLRLKHQAMLTRLISLKPAIVINNYFEHTPVLTDIQKACNCHSVNFVANPATKIEDIELSRSAYNITFDENSVANNKSAFAHIYPWGWLIQSKYEQEYDRAAVRERLGLRKEAFTLLIVSGTLGSPADISVVRSLIKSQLPIQVIYSCGNNKLLLEQVKLLKKVAERDISSDDLGSLLPLGYTTNLNQYMQAADLVMGKAGPNTLFETAATLTPFMATHHLSGHEDCNIKIIEDYQLGWVRERPEQAIKEVIKLNQQPKRLKNFCQL